MNYKLPHLIQTDSLLKNLAVKTGMLKMYDSTKQELLTRIISTLSLRIQFRMHSTEGKFTFLENSKAR